MGSYVTTSRRYNPDSFGQARGWQFLNKGPSFPPLIQKGSEYLYFSDGVVPSGYTAVPSQVTTSYRTGRGVPIEDSLVEDAFNQAPSIEGGTLNFLKSIENVDGSNQSSWDTGHTFDTTKYDLVLSHHRIRRSTVGGTTYVGPLIPLPAVTQTQWLPITSASALVNKYGPAAIAATAPTNPASTAGQGFYEILADGLPTIPKAGIGALDSIWHTIRSLAYGNLSVQFDWLPFIGDFRSTLHALVNASKITRQYYRDSGRLVRRRMTFPDSVTTTSLGKTSSFSVSGCMLSPPGIDTSKGWALPSAPDQTKFIFHPGPGSEVVETKVQKTSVYYKGAYSYFVPGDHGGRLAALKEFEEKANHLLGLELTPSLLWQLAPWSWLIDWKSQIGNSIKNFTAFQKDSLVLRYGYLMVTQTIIHDVTIHNLYTGYTTQPIDPVSPSASYITVRKERFRATPYGFGVDLNGLSARQWSILGSLGMTRSPKKLRVDD